MNVALVKLSSLGDIVHTLPVVGALRARWPDAHVTWMVERRHARVLRGHAGLNEVLTVDTRAWRRARKPSEIIDVAREIAALRRRLRAARFDAAIDFQGLAKSGVLTAMTGAPTRIGFATERCRERLNALFSSHRVMPPAASRHVVEQYLSLLSPLGVRADGVPVEFQLPSNGEADALMDEFFGASGLKARDRLVVLNAGAARPEKRWSADGFADLAVRLTREDAARVLVVWGPGEEHLASTIARSGRNGRGSTLVAPPTDIDALIALLRRASVVVSGDTGPLHLAAALGVSCVGLFGPTSAVRNGPYGSRHRALQGAEGTVSRIDVDSVHRAVRDLLE